MPLLKIIQKQAACVTVTVTVAEVCHEFTVRSSSPAKPGRERSPPLVLVPTGLNGKPVGDRFDRLLARIREDFHVPGRDSSAIKGSPSLSIGKQRPFTGKCINEQGEQGSRGANAATIDSRSKHEERARG